MKKKCSFDENLLSGFLDSTLSSQEEQLVREHLEKCSICQDLVARHRQYQAWLAQSRPLEEPADSADLPGVKARILTAVKAEKRQSFWQKPVFWFKSTAVAAALLVAVFVLPNLLPRARTVDDLAPEDFNLAQAGSKTAPAAGRNDLGETSAAPVEWGLYKGSLADLPALACIYSSKDNAESSQTEPAESTDNQTEVAEHFSAENLKLNEAGRSLLNLLKEAEDMRIVVNQGKPAKTLILAAFSPGQVNEKAADLRPALSDRAFSRIETISGQDLVARLEQIELGLYSRVFTKAPAAKLGWLLIILEGD